MLINSILKYKNWTCSFTNSYYSLKHAGIEIVDSIDGHQDLLDALVYYISRKKRSKCNYFRITDDLKNVTVVVEKNQTLFFLKYLKEISLEIDNYNSLESHENQLDEFHHEGILKDISVN